MVVITVDMLAAPTDTENKLTVDDITQFLKLNILLVDFRFNSGEEFLL